MIALSLIQDEPDNYGIPMIGWKFGEAGIRFWIAGEGLAVGYNFTGLSSLTSQDMALPPSASMSRSRHDIFQYGYYRTLQQSVLSTPPKIRLSYR